MALTAEQIKKFYDEGYLILPDFADDETVESLKKECWKLVDEMNPAEHNTVFTTLEMKRTSDDYFMTSGDKIRYFFEDGAKDEQGNLKVDKHLSINKIGHALHVLSEPFKNFTFSEKMQDVAKGLGLADPVVCQSMYIFKQPGIGGEDGIHGNRRMIRTPNKQEGDPGTTFRGEQEKYDPTDFVAGPVKKGTMVLIHGEVVHKSEKNLSSNSRHIYTFHMFDQKGTKYSTENWLQPTEAVPFTKLLA